MKPVDNLEQLFEQEFRVKTQIAQLHSDPELQGFALDLVPLEELQIRATLQLSTVEGVGLEDCLLVELLRWFKVDFFHWVDCPPCARCQRPTESRCTEAPTPEERRWDVFKVESYHCRTCDKAARFPRYNHPQKLLETREGRCGEWANCFTFLCCALGFDARIVIDWTDHAWTEVYSTAQQRWLHCDPCENVVDRPLLYEIGWKKKLSYVLAFSSKEVQDVTWRYTRDYPSTLARRKRCREEFLLHLVTSYQQKLAQELSPEDRSALVERRLQELVSFLTPPEYENVSYGGRISGSLEWRLARGEISSPTETTQYVFNLEHEEVEEKRLCLKYNCSADMYVRGTTEIGDWASCTFSYSNVSRKVESDWKMVYLARTEGSSAGQVCWQFDFSDSPLVIDQLKLSASCYTHGSGIVKWSLHPNDQPHLVKTYSLEELNPLETRDLQGCSGFTLTAELLKGSEECSWQHAQLFRQPLDSSLFPFQVEIILTDRMETQQ